MKSSQNTNTTFTTVQGYQPIKLLRWGGPGSNGTLAMTPCGEKALRQLLETFGKPEEPENAGLLCVREPWMEALFFQLTMQLLAHGVSVTDETLKATLKEMLSDAVEDSFPPAPPIGRKRGNEIAN